MFYDELRNADVPIAGNDDETHLAVRLTETARRVLPVLRLYSSWLLLNTHLLEGLTTDDILKDAIDEFWRIYAKTVDLIAAVFPIWDLEDLDEVSYLLEEDADTLGFKPINDAKTTKVWYNANTGTVKPRFCDRGVKRLTTDDETMARVKDFLVDGLYLANDDENAPIKLRGTRILHRNVEDVELPAIPALQKTQTTKVADELPQKPALKATYAAAAANGPPTKPSAPANLPNGTHSQDARLSRMVDDLVDEPEANNPVTPPQHHASHPAVVTRGDVSYSSALAGSTPDFAKMHVPEYGAYQPKPIGTPASVSGPAAVLRTTPKTATAAGGKSMGLHSVSSIWNDVSSSSANFPAGLPTGTLGSPAQMHSRGHSRVNSASSVRSRTSQGMIADSWSSLESGAPRVNGLGAGSNVASPLLFGAGGGVWSTGAGTGGGGSAYRAGSPPDGQGG